MRDVFGEILAVFADFREVRCVDVLFADVFCAAVLTSAVLVDAVLLFAVVFAAVLFDAVLFDEVLPFAVLFKAALPSAVLPADVLPADARMPVFSAVLRRLALFFEFSLCAAMMFYFIAFRNPKLFRSFFLCFSAVSSSVFRCNACFCLYICCKFMRFHENLCDSCKFDNLSSVCAFSDVSRLAILCFTLLNIHIMLKC